MESAISALRFGRQLALNAARFGYFYGLNQIVDRQARGLEARDLEASGSEGRSRYKPKRPVPSRQELMASVAALLLADAQAVRRRVAAPAEPEPGGVVGHLSRVREMLADLPEALERRASENAASVRDEPSAEGLPEYYTQDFHFQSGGYLSARSARLYDVQVETLFYGVAQAMRRAALPAIAQALAGRDQRQLALLDVACGTGRLLREVRRVWPALRLTGLDLSYAYLSEARRHLKPLRPAHLVEDNAEQIPLPDASQDVVTCVFLFHELPPGVRRRVTAEIARVLKPGGTFVFVDSLQMGDRPGWDGLLEGFPVRFHEPYFRHYAIDDLDGMFSAAGLDHQSESYAFLSKVIARRRVA